MESGQHTKWLSLWINYSSVREIILHNSNTGKSFVAKVIDYCIIKLQFSFEIEQFNYVLCLERDYEVSLGESRRQQA